MQIDRPRVRQTEPDGSSIFGPADPEALAEAAQELRDRTMSLEPAPGLPAWPLVLGLVVVVVVGVALSLAFRQEIRSFVGAAWGWAGAFILRS